MFTARVNPPRTGHRYLDAVLDQPGSTLAFAHRGGAYHPELEGLENTLAAFRHADRLGYGYLETDVHATRDGELLAFHDAVLDRVTDLKGRIEALTLAEVGEALIGGRERVPTLARPTWPSHDVPKQMHHDFRVPTVAELRRQRQRAEELGATLLYDRSDDPDEPLYVLADPAGHPFCVLVAAS